MKKTIIKTLLFKKKNITSIKMTYPLNSSWTLWFHYNKDTNWSLERYQNIFQTKELVPFCQLLKCGINFSDGIYFLMRDHITPRWEDPANAKGCLWSFKIKRESIKEAWNELCIRIVGETFTRSLEVNGISVHPKYNCYIIKIWFKQNANKFVIMKPPMTHISVRDGQYKSSNRGRNNRHSKG